MHLCVSEMCFRGLVVMASLTRNGGDMILVRASSNLACNCNIIQYYLRPDIVSPFAYIVPDFGASAFTGAPMNS